MSSPTTVRERFEKKFGQLYVRNNPSGGYFEIAPNLIPDFIEVECSAQEVRVRVRGELLKLKDKMQRQLNQGGEVSLDAYNNGVGDCIFHVEQALATPHHE